LPSTRKILKVFLIDFWYVCTVYLLTNHRIHFSKRSGLRL
jgi:hypothetical protein